MADQGQLTIYDKAGHQLAATNSNGQAAQFPNHCVVGYKDGVAKKAFFYSGPDGSSNARRAMNIAEHMAYNAR